MDIPERLTTPTPFVGRRRQLEMLERCLGDAVAGSPRFVMLAGEAGVGKSRLVRELRARADDMAVQVLCGRCAEDLPLPYLPFVEALEAALRETLGDSAEALQLLLPRVAAVESAAGALTASPAEQLLLFRTVAQTCITLAQRRPTMLVLEDLHWADRSTIDLLQHVVFTLADAALREAVPLLVIATYRPADADDRVARAVDRLRREEIAVSVDVGGLDEAEIDALISSFGLAQPTHQLVTSISATTRGNPLFVEELLHDLVKRGALRRRGGYLAAVGDIDAVRLPAELTGMIAERTRPLGVRGAEVLGLAALLGSRFSLDTLAAVSELASEEVLDLLEEAARQRLLASDGSMFEFLHPLVRHVLASQPTGVRAQRMHQRIATTLGRLHAESADDRLLEITHHLIAAGAEADPRVVLHAARLAGERAIAMSAWGEAARYWEAALASAAACDDGGPHQRAVLHHRAAFAYSRDLDGGPCLEQYELAIAAYRQTDDVCGLTRALSEQARAHVMLASAPYGALVDVEPLQQALAALGDREPLLRGQCLTTLALAYWTARRPEEAERAARAALASGAGDHRLLAEAFHALALAQIHMMRQTEALASWEQSREHARQAGDRWLESVALQRIPSALIGLGRLAEAEATALTACALGRETQNWAGCSIALGNLVLVAVARGDLAAAEDRAREALTMVRRARYGWAGPYFLPALACARVLRGTWVEAVDALTILVTPGQVFDDAGPAIQLLAWVYQQLIRAHHEPVEDDVRDRLRRLAGAGASAEIVNLAGFSALVEAGDLLDDATTAAAPYQALRVAAERGVILTIGWSFLIERVLGVGATRAGDWAQAEGHFTAAAATAERIGAAPELAHTHLDHARMLIARAGVGDRERAAALLRDAHVRFEALGLTPLVERVARVAQPLGVRFRRRRGRAARLSELSRLDLDVLRRVAQGRSVGEIADALTVAPASAEQRIRSVLEKIAVRAAAPPRAERAAPITTARPLHPLIIMFTDMEGSTAIIERLGDTRAHALLRAHDATIRSALITHGGAEVSHTGDGVMATFRSASGAIACAITIQQAFVQHRRDHPEEPIRVRVGLNAGEPIAEHGSLFGAAVHM
ncbi:MAG: AAA family ATPase, partial [bacterium]